MGRSLSGDGAEIMDFCGLAIQVVFTSENSVKNVTDHCSMCFPLGLESLC